MDPIEEQRGPNLYGIVGNNPVCSFDLYGLSDRSDIDAGRLIYSTNAGWIDWGHSRPDGPKKLWDTIRGEVGIRSDAFPTGYIMGYRQGSTRFGVSISGGSLYWVRYKLSLGQKESVALGIFKEITDQFGGLQSLFPDFISTSGNSEEDRPSNLIAFYRAVKGYERVDIEQWAKVRTKEESKCLWDKIGGIKRSKSWTPTDYNAELASVIGKPVSRLSWPSQLSVIKEARKGRYGEKGVFFGVMRVLGIFHCLPWGPNVQYNEERLFCFIGFADSLRLRCS